MFLTFEEKTNTQIRKRIRCQRNKEKDQKINGVPNNYLLNKCVIEK